MARSKIAFYSVLAFLAGVFAASLGLAIFLITGLGIIVLSRWISISERKAWIASGLIFAALHAGFFYYFFFLAYSRMHESIPIGYAEVRAVVIEVSRSDADGQRVTLELESPHHGQAHGTLRVLPALRYGDELDLKGTFLPRQTAGTLPEVIRPTHRILLHNRGFWLKAQLVELREGVLDQFRRYFSPDAASFLGGLTLGARGSLSQELRSEMAQSGTTHLVALSGYNIAILVFAISKLLGSFLHRRLRFWLTLAIIGAFVLMTGTQASIVRAAIMGALMLAASESGRIYSFPYALVYTAFGMALFDPTILRFDLGFELSFLSLIGVSFLAPALNAFFKVSDSPGVLAWRANLVTTTSAQLAVLPVVIANFHSFSITAIAANALILPFIPLTMGLGFAIAGLGIFSEYLALAISWLAAVLLKYELGVIHFFANWRWPLELPFYNWIVSSLYYACLALFILKMAAKKNTAIPVI